MKLYSRFILIIYSNANLFGRKHEHSSRVESERDEFHVSRNECTNSFHGSWTGQKSQTNYHVNTLRSNGSFENEKEDEKEIMTQI